MRNSIVDKSADRISVSRIVLLVLLVFAISGCDPGSDKASDKTRATLDITGFLKEQYFTVADTLIPVKDFDYKLLNGEKELFSSNQGKIVLLNFWAVWCYPCQKEMPDIQKLVDQMQGEPFRMLAVNYGDDPGNVTRWIQKFSYTFDVVMDEDKSISAQLNVTGLPTTFVIDKKGRVLGKLVGPANWSKVAFLEFFKTLSRKQP
ncbi:MAG: TlpA disulfide reductase family protein [bacterium]